MKATDILMEEHQVILRVITTLEAGALALNRGEPVRAEFFIDAASFIKGFADGCHHQKEEGVLFKEMVANGMSLQGGPIAVMLFEHGAGLYESGGGRRECLQEVIARRAEVAITP
jgi:hemerythrin-like domain-containing protein